MAEELTDRQQALIAQVKAGDVEESEPDTEDQLLALARLGYLHAEAADGEWKFTVPEQPAEDTQAAAEQEQPAEQPQPEPQPSAAQPADDSLSGRVDALEQKLVELWDHVHGGSDQAGQPPEGGQPQEGQAAAEQPAG